MYKHKPHFVTIDVWLPADKLPEPQYRAAPL